MKNLWDRVVDEARELPQAIREEPVVRIVAAEDLRGELEERYGDFDGPRATDEVIDHVAGMLRRGTVHVTHPRYFGLFNPAVLPSAVAGDALAALFNPQLATWSHAPAANEIERHVLDFFRRRFGLPEPCAMNFTTGGAEANLSAVLAALAHHYPAWAEEGLAALPKSVSIYVSAEGHDSITKVARMTGLGRGVLRTIEVDARFRMTPEALSERIERDRRRGRRPLMVVGNAGTTGAGAVDPLEALATVAEDEGAWFHVDAAYGGMAALSPRLAPALAGIERADSITFDAHKGLPVPMGAGMFFCRHADAVARAFSVGPSYRSGSVRDTVDPYLTTAQWSRRFIGLKVFCVLAEHGAEGVARLIEGQAAMADLLRELLTDADWRIVNDTPLPVVCFTRPGLGPAHDLAKRVRATGEAWISSVRLGNPPVEALRACITNHRTEEEDLRELRGLISRLKA
jgi:aromatic-L-amino-acid/L-tryptophan decarboxylase